MLVPFIVVVPPPSLSDSTLTPGAQTSTSGPRLLNEAIPLAESMAETAITFRYLAGNPTLEVAGGTGRQSLVAGRSHQQQAFVPGRVTHRLQGRGGGGATQAHADYVHAILDAPVDAGDDPGELATAVAVEDLDAIERRLRRHADNVRALDGGGNRSGTVRAVALIVHGRGDARDEARAAYVVRLKVRVVEVDAGIDDRDPYPLALGIAPGLRGVHLLDASRNGLGEGGRLVFHSQVGERTTEGVITEGVARGIVLDHRYVVVLPQGIDFALGQLRGHDGDLVLIDVIADQLRIERRTCGTQGQCCRVQEVRLHALRERAADDVDLVGRAVRALVLAFERNDDGSTLWVVVVADRRSAIFPLLCRMHGRDKMGAA